MVKKFFTVILSLALLSTTSLACFADTTSVENSILSTESKGISPLSTDPGGGGGYHRDDISFGVLYKGGPVVLIMNKKGYSDLKVAINTGEGLGGLSTLLLYTQKMRWTVPVGVITGSIAAAWTVGSAQAEWQFEKGQEYATIVLPIPSQPDLPIAPSF